MQELQGNHNLEQIVGMVRLGGVAAAPATTCQGTEQRLRRAATQARREVVLRGLMPDLKGATVRELRHETSGWARLAGCGRPHQETTDACKRIVRTGSVRATREPTRGGSETGPAAHRFPAELRGHVA